MKQFLIVCCIVSCIASCKKYFSTQSAVVTNELNTSKQERSLELVYLDSTYELNGVAVSKTGRMFTNYPLWNNPHKYDVVEITGVNSRKPYPNELANSWKDGDDGLSKWVCVQALYVDDDDKLWVVDPASPFFKGVYQHSYKLVKFNLKTNRPEKIYRFNYTADVNSYINDVRVDTKLNYAYLTNSNEGGIFVINLNTGKIRQVLQGSPSVISDPSYNFIVDGKELKQNGAPLKFNSDGIALTPDGNYIYYKPTTDDKLYRIKTKFLRDENLTAAKLASKVEDLGHFSSSDGMIFDKDGNLYLSDAENYRIVKITPDLKMHVFIASPLLIWPDSFSIADGYLYVSCSQLQKQPMYNTHSPTWPPSTPFTIYKVKL